MNGCVWNSQVVVDHSKEIFYNCPYRHWKTGNLYNVIGHGKDSETLQDVIIYEALYGNGQVWVMPWDMWFDVMDDKGTKRFELV
jgi:hypothetical protein